MEVVGAIGVRLWFRHPLSFPPPPPPPLPFPSFFFPFLLSPPPYKEREVLNVDNYSGARLRLPQGTPTGLHSFFSSPFSPPPYSFPPFIGKVHRIAAENTSWANHDGLSHHEAVRLFLFFPLFFFFLSFFLSPLFPPFLLSREENKTERYLR